MPFADLRPTALERAWSRCILSGMLPSDRVEFEAVGRTLLSELEERYLPLVTHAQPHMQFLSRSTARAGCLILLINQDGVVVKRYGRTDLVDAELSLVSRVGINLSERCVGATAPSIALAEYRPSVVFGDAHFSSSLHRFHCVAAPIEGLHGELLGAVNITAHGTAPRFDALAMVVDTVRSIENSLYRSESHCQRPEFHVHPDWVGSPSGCVVLLDDDDKIVAANRAARKMLDMSLTDLQGLPFGALFDIDVQGAMGSSARGSAGLAEWSMPSGLLVFGRLAAEPGSHPRNSRLGGLRQTMAPEAALTQAPVRLAEIQCQAIEIALERSKGNVSAAARLLGVSRQTVYRHSKGH